MNKLVLEKILGQCNLSCCESVWVDGVSVYEVDTLEYEGGGVAEWELNDR